MFSSWVQNRRVVSMNDVMRESFEEWVTPKYIIFAGHLNRTNSGYLNDEIEGMWQAWQASREANYLEGYKLPFDYKTASELIIGKCSDNVRAFVSHARWANDECNSNRNTIADLRNDIRRRDAEIEMLKSALLEAEASRAVPIVLPLPIARVTYAGGTLDAIPLEKTKAALIVQGYKVAE
jgi:hypothetical protein